MSKTLTPRFGLTQWGAGTDSPLRTDFNGTFAAIESQAMISQQGVLGSRTAPSAASRGRIFTVQGEIGSNVYLNGRQFYDNGTEWVALGSNIVDTISRPSNASLVPLTVQGLDGQSANLQEWKNSGGTVVAAVSPSGAISALGTALGGTTAQRLTQGTAANKVVDLVKAASGQSVDVAQWTASDNSMLAKISSTGQFSAKGIDAGGALSGVTTLAASGAATLSSLVTNLIKPNGAVPTVVQANAGQTTGDLVQIKNAAGTNIFAVGTDGTLTGGGFVAGSAAARMLITADIATRVASIVKGANAQTADLAQWRDNSEVILAKITSTGWLSTPRVDSANGVFGTLTGSTSVTTPLASLVELTSPTGSAALKVTAVAGHTNAHLLDLIKNGTIVASVGSDGAIRSNYGFRSGPAIGADSNTFAESLIADSMSASSVVAIIRGSAGQSADLLRVVDSANVGMFVVGASGSASLYNALNAQGDIITSGGKFAGAKAEFGIVTNDAEKIRFLNTGPMAMGVQPDSLYTRLGTDQHWRMYRNGAHATSGPGSGGDELFDLDVTNRVLRLDRLNIRLMGAINDADPPLRIGDNSGQHLNIHNATIQAYGPGQSSNVTLNLQAGSQGQLTLGGADTKILVNSRTIWFGSSRLYLGFSTWDAQGGGPIDNDWWLDGSNNAIKVRGPSNNWITVASA